ncbi:helix-turn-helix domain-containing protein, partial [Pseudomonas sp. SB113]
MPGHSKQRLTVKAMKNPKQDDHRLALQRRLLSATMEVALENGFGNVTMEAVAAKADVSKGGLLYHFATKDDLIRALLECSIKCANSAEQSGSI